MFLKRIEIQGFKSFADHIIINFDQPIVAIVGPNGCGKSNISDAIRWVLGEQSVKSLRGDKMTDVIFSGSQNRKAQAMAEVTLVFDNRQRFLNSDQDEIEITRKIYLENQELEYLINHNRVRLKDISDLILDSGLGKDSLSIISQGNISAFADAKPYERRSVFEDAAGVSKYKKRKIEALARLERSKNQLERSFDILSELEKQLKPLKKAAEKALLFKDKKETLKQIEIAVLVNDITNLNIKKEEIDKTIFEINNKIAVLETQKQVQNNEITLTQQELKDYDYRLNKLQDQLLKLVEQIQFLNNKKIELEEKRKYALEHGNTQDKIESLQAMLKEAQYEYEKSNEKYLELKNIIEHQSQELDHINTSLIEENIAKDENDIIIRKLENRSELLENLLKDPYKSQAHYGIKSIMQNKQSLLGIHDVVGNILISQTGYEEALKASLANSAYHIVANDEKAAQKAIEFLKKNKAGRATFIPLNSLKTYFIRIEHEIIAQKTKGYLGIMSDFVEYEDKYQLLAESLLGNTIVCDQLENAIILSQLLDQSYKIVTLEGDLINRGGTLTGGKIKDEVSIVTLKFQLENIKVELDSLNATLAIKNKNIDALKYKQSKLQETITNNRILAAQLEQLLDIKKHKWTKIENDLEILNKDNINSNDQVINDFVIQLQQAESNRAQLNFDIKNTKENKQRLSNELDKKELNYRKLINELELFKKEENTKLLEKTRIETNLDNQLHHLSFEYQLTYEYAKNNYVIEISDHAYDDVRRLRDELSALGNISMTAPMEYQEINQRYQELKKNYDDLCSSRDKLLDVIDEMDKTMKKQFKDIFEKINQELPNTFKVLFGGGQAKLIMEDPSDLLNTGIDIDVQPPGKQVKSMKLFSGGEKALIAICVLFTILKVRSIPLVVFDEVEAALDQANVERFAKYVKDFSKETQFIIITHRPGTMAQANALYGVTMQQQGVSQMLKVELVDALKMSDKKGE